MFGFASTSTEIVLRTTTHCRQSQGYIVHVLLGWLCYILFIAVDLKLFKIVYFLSNPVPRSDVVANLQLIANCKKSANLGNSSHKGVQYSSINAKNTINIFLPSIMQLYWKKG